MTLDTSELGRLRGCQLVDRDGDKVGKIDEIYLDQETGRPEWFAVNTGLFGSKVSFVPLAEATTEGDSVRVPYEKAQIKDAPNVEADRELSHEEEGRLYRHYGLDHGDSTSGVSDDGGRFATGERTDAGGTERTRTAGRDVSGPTTDDAMTRSEEELKVGTAKRETGRARLRKYVETETVTESVPVQRQELRVEREPITDANIGRATDGPEISEEEHEVVLHEETPVVEKQVVPKERVRMDVDTRTDEETVSEDVRRERIDVESDDAA